VIAIALAGLVLVGAHLSMSSVERWRALIAHDQLRFDDRGEGFTELSELFAMLETGSTESPPFFGDASGATFRSRCRAVTGGLEPCDIRLQATKHRGAGSLQMHVLGRWSRTVITADEAITLRYLERTEAGGRWRESWGALQAQPVAIAVIAAADTFVFRGVAP
jgi:hypothetical protein